MGRTALVSKLKVESLFCTVTFYIDKQMLDAESNHFPLNEESPLDPQSRHSGKAETENWLTKEGIPFTSLPSLNHQIPLVSDSVRSEFCDEPPAYAVVTINSEQLTIHFNTFMQRNELHQTEIL